MEDACQVFSENQGSSEPTNSESLVGKNGPLKAQICAYASETEVAAVLRREEPTEQSSSAVEKVGPGIRPRPPVENVTPSFLVMSLSKTFFSPPFTLQGEPKEFLEEQRVPEEECEVSGDLTTDVCHLWNGGRSHRLLQVTCSAGQGRRDEIFVKCS